MKTVSVKFSSGYQEKTYAYLTDIDDVSVGDTVVVESPHSGMTCVVVKGIDDSAEAISKATKWVVCKVNDTAYRARIEAEREKAKILAKLQKIKAQVLEQNQFEELARLSPEAADLVKQLKTLI